MGHFHLQRHFEGLDPSRNEKGVKMKERKKGKWGWDSGWAAGNTSTVSLLDDRDGICEDTKRWHSYVTGLYCVLNPHLSVSPEKKKKKRRMFSTTFLSNHALGVDMHAEWRVHKVWCVDFNRTLLAIWNTPVTRQFVLPEKSCTLFQKLYNYKESVFLWLEKSILHWKMYSRKKKAFCTPFLMFEMRLKKKIKTLRNVPFSCKLYLYLFALFSLLYFVCTHSITTNCYIKNMNN